MRLGQRGQQFGEYAITIGLVATAFLGMQMVVSRRVGGALVGVSQQIWGEPESGQSQSTSNSDSWTRERFDPGIHLVQTQTGSTAGGGSSSGYLLAEDPYPPYEGEGMIFPAGSVQQLAGYLVARDTDPDHKSKTLPDTRSALDEDSPPSEIKSRRLPVTYRVLAVVEDEKNGMLYALVDLNQDGEGDEVLTGQFTDVSKAKSLKSAVAEWIKWEELNQEWDSANPAMPSVAAPHQRDALRRGVKAYRGLMEDETLLSEFSSVLKLTPAERSKGLPAVVDKLKQMAPADRSKAITEMVEKLPPAMRNALNGQMYGKQLATIDAKKIVQRLEKEDLIAEIGWDAHQKGGALPKDLQKDLAGAPEWRSVLVLGHRLQATLQSFAKQGVPITDDGSGSGKIGQAMTKLTDELKKAGVTVTWDAKGNLSMAGDLAGAQKKLDPNVLNSVKSELDTSSAQFSKDFDRHYRLGNEQHPATTGLPHVSVERVKEMAKEPPPANVSAIIEKGAWVDKDGDRLPDAKVVYGEGPIKGQPLGPDNQPKPTEVAGVTWTKLERPGPPGGVGLVEKTAPQEFFNGFVKDRMGVQPEQAPAPVVNRLRDDKLTGDEVRAAGGHPSDFGGIDGWIRYEPETLPKTATPIFRPTSAEPVHTGNTYRPSGTGVPEPQPGAGPSSSGTLPSYIDPTHIDRTQPLPQPGSFGAPVTSGAPPETTYQPPINQGNN